MKSELFQEFKSIYKDTVEDVVLESVVKHIDTILLQNNDKVYLKTRNPQGKPLLYFSIEGKTKTIPVIFAGGRDPDADGIKRPSIRFRENTDILSQIPEKMKYPSMLSRKEPWVCVEIHRSTVNYLPILMDNAIRDYVK